MGYYEDEGLMIRKGDNGEVVKLLQADLIRLGYDVGGGDGLPDGDFGAKTERAVKSFQENRLVTGVVDYATAVAIRAGLGNEPTPELDIEFIKSPSFSSRKGNAVDMLVIHYTAGGNMDGAVDIFENPSKDVSAHYLIGTDGRVVQMVKEDKKAWHAGKSEWNRRKNCNEFSIGIEIVNWGPLEKKGDKFYTWPRSYTNKYSGSEPVLAKKRFWEPYRDVQYDVLTKLSKSIITRHSIPISRIVGHHDIAPTRKIDPGPHFDWDRFKGSL